MTLVLGQQDQSDCDFCCECGAFCTGGYCGASMLWVATPSGSTNGTLCTDCSTDIDIAVAFNAFMGSVNATDWNASRPSWTSHDAMSGSKVCVWKTDGSTFGTVVDYCGFAGVIRSHVITTYLGTDGKWRMVFAADVVDFGYTGAIVGEAEFASGGAPMDCGTPGEGSPTFSLSIPLTSIVYFGSSALSCLPPTSVLVEGNPQ